MTLPLEIARLDPMPYTGVQRIHQFDIIFVM